MNQDKRLSFFTKRYWQDVAEKLMEPASIGPALLVLFGVLLLAVLHLASRNWQSDEVRALKAEIGDIKVSVSQLLEQGRQRQTEADEALTKASKYLDAKNFALAYDFLLVASRLSPSDRRLFDAVLNFIEQAKGSDEAEDVALVEDLLDRGDTLVHFLPPDAVESSRERLNKVREEFVKPLMKEVSEPEFQAIARLVKVAEDSKQPVETRSRAAERAREAIDGARFDLRLSADPLASDTKPSVLDEFQARTKKAESDCVTDFFEQQRKSADEWHKASQGLIEKLRATSTQAWSIVSKDIDKSIEKGMGWLQEVAPYVRSEVKDAGDLSSKLEQQIKLLQRMKTWIYNQQALNQIRAVEADTKSMAMGKIKVLALINEDLLSPYFAQRLSVVWEKAFDNLGSEDDKVEAVRLRILHTGE